jgi:hypothetical protein
VISGKTGTSVLGPLVQEIVQCRDVGLGHLQRLVLAQLSILSQLGKKRPQPVERLVEVLHAAPLSSVGGETSLAEDQRGDATLASGSGVAALFGEAVVAGGGRPVGGLLRSHHVQVGVVGVHREPRLWRCGLVAGL